MQNVLLCIALYAKCPFYLLLHMQSVLIMYCFICKVTPLNLLRYNIMQSDLVRMPTLGGAVSSFSMARSTIFSFSLSFCAKSFIIPCDEVWFQRRSESTGILRRQPILQKSAVGQRTFWKHSVQPINCWWVGCCAVKKNRFT